MEGSNKKQLSYEPKKAILQCLSFEKREQIHWRIPGLRKTNALFPYQYDKAIFQKDSLTINGRGFCWDPAVEYSETLPPVYVNCVDMHRGCKIVPGQTDFSTSQSGKQFPVLLKRFRVYKSPEVVAKRIVSDFINNGTKIRELFLYGTLLGALSGKDPEKFKLKASKINMGDRELLENEKELMELLTFIDQSSVESVEVGSSKYDKILEIQLVQTCKNLFLRLFHEQVPWNHLENYTNLHTKCDAYSFRFDAMAHFILNWSISHRPIGSTFTIGVYDYNKVFDLYVHLVEHHGATWTKVAKRGDSFHANGVILEMPHNDSELVVFTGPKEFDSTRWTLDLEIVKPTSGEQSNDLEALKFENLEI